MPEHPVKKPIVTKHLFSRISGLFLIAVLLSGCTKPAQQYDYSIFSFGTLIDVTLYDVDKTQADEAFEQLQNMFDEQHQNWSPWTNGDLAQLNSKLSENADGKTPVDVPEHLIPIIKQSMELSRQSDNFYNPAIGRLINLWQFHKYQDEDIHPPADSEIRALVKKQPQMSNLSFDKQNRLVNNNPAVLLNFGAFAKGYGIGLGIRLLERLHINNAIINAGGDLSVIGQHGNRAWNIGIRDPRNDGILASVEVKDNESIFTSGDYERYYFYQSKRYHHILDPTTGYPTQDAQSVTVLHRDPGIADAAATALFVAGSRNWESVARSMGIDFVMLIDATGDIHLTPDMEKRIKFINKPPPAHIIISRKL